MEEKRIKIESNDGIFAVEKLEDDYFVFEMKSKKHFFTKSTEVIVLKKEVKNLCEYLDNLKETEDDLYGHFLRCSCYTDAFNFSKLDSDVYINYWISGKVSIKRYIVEMSTSFKEIKEFSQKLSQLL